MYSNNVHTKLQVCILLQSSPQTRTGFSPAAKRPTVATPSQPSTHTVHEKAPSVLSSVANVINQPTLAQATWECPKKLPFQQEEITIKVYENLEDDEEDNVKVHYLLDWGEGCAREVGIL